MWNEAFRLGITNLREISEQGVDDIGFVYGFSAVGSPADQEFAFALEIYGHGNFLTVLDFKRYVVEILTRIEKDK